MCMPGWCVRVNKRFLRKIHGRARAIASEMADQFVMIEAVPSRDW